VSGDQLGEGEGRERHGVGRTAVDFADFAFVVHDVAVCGEYDDACETAD